jgi:curved DNA-binding protein CbpA
MTAHQKYEAEERFRAINEAYQLLMKSVAAGGAEESGFTNAQADANYEDFRVRQQQRREKEKREAEEREAKERKRERER